MLIADLHTHTTYSHGKGTVEQNVLAAIEKGLKRVGISEHGPRHLFFPVKWEALLKLRREIDAMNARYGSQIEVLMGLEANLLGDGLTDVPDDRSIFDYVLLGYHKGTFPQDAVGRRWMRGLLFAQRAVHHKKENALAYAHAMDGLPNLMAITHPGTYIPVDYELLGREAAARGVALEINEAHRNVTADDLRVITQAGAALFIGSDAHRPSRVGDAPNSLALAAEAGVMQYVINCKD